MQEVFWNKFSEIYGEEVRADIPLFEEYYKNDFQQVQSVCGYNPDKSRFHINIQGKIPKRRNLCLILNLIIL